MVNADLGDELEHRGNGLRIEMGIRNSEGATVQLTPEGLAIGFPSATPRLVVLVHGLGRTESCWLGRQ